MFVYDCVFVVWNMWVENEFGHAESMYRNWKKFTYVYNCIVCHTVERYILHHNDIGLRTYCCVDIKTGTCDINKQTLFHTSHVI